MTRFPHVKLVFLLVLVIFCLLSSLLASDQPLADKPMWGRPADIQTGEVSSAPAMASAPVITGFMPPSVPVGWGPVAMEIQGHGFDSFATVRWNGEDTLTFNRSPTSMGFVPGDTSAVSTVEITVVNPGPPELESEAVIFTIRTPTTFYVNDDAPHDPAPYDPNVSDPLEDGSENHPFDRVQEALDVSFQVDTVRILPGEYIENLVVKNSGTRILGDGVEETVIRSLGGILLRADSRHDLFSYLGPRNWSVQISHIAMLGGDILFRGITDSSMSQVYIDGNINFHADIIDGSHENHSLDSVRLGRGVMTVGPVLSFGIPTRVSISSLDAPEATLIIPVMGQGWRDLTLENSTVGTLILGSFQDEGGGTAHIGRSTFTNGLEAIGRSIAAVVQDSIFLAGGMNVAFSAGLDSATFGRVQVIRSTFIGDGIEFRAFMGSAGDLHSVGLSVESTRFNGGGINIDVRDAAEHHGKQFSDIRISNSVFENSISCVKAQYDLGGSGRLASPHILDLGNNTLFSCDVGIAIEIDSFPLDNRPFYLRASNNIITNGVVGVQMSGTQDQQIVYSANNVFENLSADYSGDLSDPTGSNMNISRDPMFLAPEQGKYLLRPESPSIDAGDIETPAKMIDIRGSIRPVDGDGDGVATIDIGAYEFRDSDIAECGDSLVAIDSLELDGSVLSWSSSQDSGSEPAYDVVKSSGANDFISVGCLESSDGKDRIAVDALLPAPGYAFYYLVRPVDACGRIGPAGSNSQGVPRSVASCP